MANPNDRCDLVGNVRRVAHCLAHDVDCLRGRVAVDGAEINQSRVEVIARTHFNRFFGGNGITDVDNVVLTSAELNCAPADSFDDADVISDDNHVADLKRTIGMQGNAGEEITKSIL